MTPSGGPLAYGPPPPPPAPPGPPQPAPLGPPPPPGPGVQPPFVAPPVDGKRRRRWIALAWTGSAALVLCIGGAVGVGALAVFGSQMIVDQSKAAVRDYLTALQEREFAKAYSMQCLSEQHRISESQFERQQRQLQVSDFTVLEPDLTNQNIVVPAVVQYAYGGSSTLRYQIAQNESTGEFEVCGSGS